MLKRTLIVSVLAIAGFAAGIALHTALTRGDTVFSWKRPADLGVRDGRLARPNRNPNNVSSQAPQADAQHYIAPLRYRGNAADAMATLRKVLDAMERTLVVRHEPDYLYAEFRSKLVGFVDDVEFYLEESDGVIHVRSASRVGRRDFDVNRKRIEAVRRRFEAAQGQTVRT